MDVLFRSARADEADLLGERRTEGFYLAMGAERVGGTRSGSITGRTLPLLLLRIPG